MGKQTFVDGKTTMCIQERRASIKDFYGESHFKTNHFCFYLRCYISFDIATRKWDNGFGREETKINICYQDWQVSVMPWFSSIV
uniref:Uncharacterized protein n=1 Tax=Lactuca sativa TaxID=4236 RepID=A0A9R1W549_LACSA|nr:hypothetical protein LSAT_V11C200071300 [Lactuca sativa]